MRIRLILLLALFISPQSHAADAPRVVVSIAPIHSLVSGVMAGVSTPELLVKGAVSPHTYMLKPSQIASLQQADLIVWSGEGVESFMPRTLRTLNGKTRVIKLSVLPGMKLLPARGGGLWGGGEAHEDHDHGNIDGHLWLDPDNAAVVVTAVVAALSDLDPSHAALYRRNSQTLMQRFKQLDSELNTMLSPVRSAPYLVFHDGYHYFEERYHLNAIGAISVDPERKPGAKRLRELNGMIKQRQVHCLFSEPQFPADVVEMLIAGSNVKSGVLDPQGGALPPGPDLYFGLMRGLGTTLAECLK